jgi:hypothetical protein
MNTTKLKGRKMDMKFNVAQTVVGVVGCLTILGATYITKTPECLLALLIMIPILVVLE